MKVLNLYSGIGGNRKLWKDVEVTAIEIDPKIAEIYSDFYPDDRIIIIDAHQYLLDHYKEYDFIWSSPPCPSHSITNHFLNPQGHVRYPDMKLYEEIIFLDKFFHGLYCVENVKSYYKPLIRPTELDRHYFWSNFYLLPFKPERDFNIANARTSTRLDSDEYTESLEDYHDIYLPKGTYKKRLLLRNCVYPPLGEHVLYCAKRTIQLTLFNFESPIAEFTNKEGSE